MRRRYVAATVGTALFLSTFGISEGLLPSLAQDRVRDELAAIGTVKDVEISAFPAARMLFGSVDRASVTMSSATLEATSLDPTLVSKAGSADEVDLKIDQVHAGPFDVDDVVVAKRGQDLAVSGILDPKKIEELLPGAEMTVVEGRLQLNLSDLPLPLPLPGPLELEVVAVDGEIVARPVGALAALMPPQPLLNRPDLTVDSLQGSLDNGLLTVKAEGELDES